MLLSKFLLEFFPLEGLSEMTIYFILQLLAGFIYFAFALSLEYYISISSLFFSLDPGMNTMCRIKPKITHSRHTNEK